MIQTKVARVVSPTEVVLAAGEEDGVQEGMEFVIYAHSDHVIDPETGEDLGPIELVKGRVVAAHVQDKITVARTKSRVIERIVPAFSAAAALADLLKTTERETIYEQLKVEGVKALPTDQTVRVGDHVRSVKQPAALARMS